MSITEHRPSNDTNGNGARAGARPSDSASWRQFADATTQESFCTAWLSLQCRMVAGVAGGVVLLGAPAEGRPYAPVAFWPDRQRDLKHLAEVAERAISERRGLILRRSAPNGSGDNGRARFDIAYPIQANHRLFGVVALDIDSRAEADLNEVMRQLQWGSAWLEVLYHRHGAASAAAPNERLQAVVDSIATIAGEGR